MTTIDSNARNSEVTVAPQLRSRGRVLVSGKYVDWFKGEKAPAVPSDRGAFPASSSQPVSAGQAATSLIPPKLVIPASQKLSTPEEVAGRTLYALTEVATKCTA